MEENNVEVFRELIKREPGFLDRPLEELVPLRFLGEVAVEAYKALIKRIDNLPMAQEEKEAKLKDGQDAGKALLSIETKIGELLSKIPRQSGKKLAGSASLYEKAIGDKAESSIGRNARRSQEIFKHPEEVEEVIEEAEENEDIPTKTAVLNKIKLKKYMEQHPKPDKRLPNVNEIANNVNSKLIECFTKLRSIWKYEDQINQITRDTIYETIDDLYQFILGG